MVTYDDSLPVVWTPGELPEHERLSVATTNEYVLEAVAAIEEHANEPLSEDQPELHQELKRMDAKIHLVLDMLARMMQDREGWPRPRRVRIGLERIEFRAGDDDLAPGQVGSLSLYLHSAIPEPLRLTGTVAEPFDDDDGRTWRALDLDPMERELRDRLSRHIFRHHRRSVAAARRLGGDAE
mgnify:CR=1 FL=1